LKVISRHFLPKFSINMNRLFFIIIQFFTFSVHGQKIALLSTDFKSPILYTDSLTVEQVSSGHFAVNVNDIDTLVGSLSYLKNLLTKMTRSKLESWEFRTGKTTIRTFRIPKAYGDRYSILAKSTFDNITSSVDLTTEKNNKRNSERMTNCSSI